MQTVQEVRIKHFKVLKNFEAEVAGHDILLLGDNGVGKSSFIQFIEIALGKSNTIPRGADAEGHVITTKDGKRYEFHVKMKAGKRVVTITGPDGLKDNKVGTLTSLIGAMEFDIEEFVNLSRNAAGRKQQVEIFKGFLDKETCDTINRMQADVQVKFDERTEVSKVIKTFEVKEKAHALTLEINLDKFQEVDLKEVNVQLKKAQEFNEGRKAIQTRITERCSTILTAGPEITKAETLIAKLEKELLEAKSDLLTRQNNVADLKKKNNEATEWLAKNPAQPTEAFDQQIESASETNKKHAAAQELKKIRTDLLRVKAEHEALTVVIETSREEIRRTIKEMGGPVEGLSFDEENLLYNGVIVSPDTLSTSEIMELGVRLKMAENPELGILFIQHGESLGEKRFKDILQIAKKAGWQVIMEQVQRGNKQLTIEIIAE